MSHFYGFTYEYILDLPLKVFTLYNTNQTRIQAEEDLRAFSIQLASNSADSAKSLMRRLSDELGNPVIVEKAMEAGAIDRLRALSEKLNGNR